MVSCSWFIRNSWSGYWVTAASSLQINGVLWCRCVLFRKWWHVATQSVHAERSGVRTIRPWPIYGRDIWTMKSLSTLWTHRNSWGGRKGDDPPGTEAFSDKPPTQLKSQHVARNQRGLFTYFKICYGPVHLYTSTQPLHLFLWGFPSTSQTTKTKQCKKMHTKIFNVQD